jgi:hypothetical protein
MKPIEGLRFLFDERGRQTAVLFDVKSNPELWEDFYDNLICEARKSGPFETIEEVRARLKAAHSRRKPAAQDAAAPARTASRKAALLAR